MITGIWSKGLGVFGAKGYVYLKLRITVFEAKGHGYLELRVTGIWS